MERSDRLSPRPYRRRTEEEWVELKQLYQAGASAKVLAERFGGTERGIYMRLSKDGALRRDQPARPTTLGGAEALDRARDLQGVEADAPCRALSEDAPLTDAADAAARSAVRNLRAGDLSRALNLMRLARLFQRFGLSSGVGTDAAVESPGSQIALDFLKTRLFVDPEHG